MESMEFDAGLPRDGGLNVRRPVSAAAEAQTDYHRLVTSSLVLGLDHVCSPGSGHYFILSDSSSIDPFGAERLFTFARSFEYAQRAISLVLFTCLSLHTFPCPAVRFTLARSLHDS